MCIKKRPNKDLAWQPLVLSKKEGQFLLTGRVYISITLVGHKIIQNDYYFLLSCHLTKYKMMESCLLLMARRLDFSYKNLLQCRVIIADIFPTHPSSLSKQP